MLDGAVNMLKSAEGSPPSPRPPSSDDRITAECILGFSSDPESPPPDVRPCDTPNGSDALQDLTSDKVYHLFGNRRFRQYEHFGRTTKDAKFVQGGEPCPSIGEFATMNRRKRGKALSPSHHYLDKVHMDIAFGDTISKLGYRYGLLLVDHATKYMWFYGVRSLSSASVIEALEQLRADA